MDFQTKKTPPAVLFFDDECLVCNRFIQFVLNQDRERGLFRFAALQSELGQSLLKKKNLREYPAETRMLLEGQEVHSQSTAFLQVLQQLGGFWKIISWLKIIPVDLRDLVYRWFARNRYRFGKARGQCTIPSVRQRTYFINPKV